MTIKEKKQAFLFAAAFLFMLIAGLVLLRGPRGSTMPNPQRQAHEAEADSLAPIARAPIRIAPIDSGVTLAHDSARIVSLQAPLTPPDSAQTPAFPSAPALRDTLRRYGAHAAAVQMFVELLEEKQLLMEERVELARRLEIAEILDSALVYQNATNDSFSSPWDSSLSPRPDSLTHKPGSTPPDSLPRKGVFIPLE
jgi:hypothetical protein